MSNLSLLRLQAGSAALKHFQRHGLNMQDFGYLLAASGGPKWLVLTGLDAYLCQQHLPTMAGIHGLGTSAGAFRLACYAQDHPHQAITQFAKNYIATTYSSPRPKMRERDQSVKAILDDILLGKEQQIINNPYMRPHWISAQCQGLGRLPGQWSQATNLGLSYLFNCAGRRQLRHLYTRACFRPANSQLWLKDPYQLPTQYYPMQQDNLYTSLLASGTIPLFSPLRQNIKGAPGGHLDGGIVDYHFDLQLQGADKSLILYPHFTDQPRAGWFDKHLARPPSATSYDRTLLLTPGKAFMARLKNNRIPERNDFRAYDDNTRIKAWTKATDLSRYLADELDQILHTQDIGRIEPLMLS
ncbi:MAG: patatin-like phospholipase family protein [Gammaproteobacteria bacterium]|jgi:hypothetical protein|nr:patatin-like phospholipase family protein [Gammaproteobacteria bacterium]